MQDEQRKVEHKYQDHSNEVENRTPDSSTTTAGNGIGHASDRNFPVKLHFMLNELDSDGLSHIISWQPHGRCFVVHKQDEFVKTVLPMWFRQSKFASFQRQLNLYGFKRLTSGRDKGGYYHEFFLRSKPFLAHKIPRTKLKNEGARKSTSPETEPNFYLLPYLPEEEPKSSNRMHALTNGDFAHTSDHRNVQVESVPSCLSGSTNLDLSRLTLPSSGIQLASAMSTLGIPGLPGIFPSLQTSSLSNDDMLSQLIYQQALQQQAFANQQALATNLPSLHLLQQLGQYNNMTNTTTLLDATRLAQQQQLYDTIATNNANSLTNLLTNRDLLALRLAVNGPIGSNLSVGNNLGMGNNTSIEEIIRNAATAGVVGNHEPTESRSSNNTPTMTNVQRFLSKVSSKNDGRQ